MNTLAAFCVFLIPIVGLGIAVCGILAALNRKPRKPTSWATPKAGIISHKTQDNPGYGYILPRDYHQAHK